VHEAAARVPARYGSGIDQFQQVWLLYTCVLCSPEEAQCHCCDNPVDLLFARRSDDQSDDFLSHASLQWSKNVLVRPAHIAELYGDQLHGCQAVPYWASCFSGIQKVGMCLLKT